MRLYLIRHAESTNNASWGKQDGSVHVRTADPELSETGHQQSILLAQYLSTSGTEPRQTPLKRQANADFAIDRVYCSLMNRSLQTADYVGKYCGVEVEALADVFERKGLFDLDDQGVARGIAGPPRTYFEQRYPDIRLPQSLSDEGWWNRPVETDQQFLQRVEESLQRIIQIHQTENSRVAIVVHGDYLDQAINFCMSVPRRSENYASPWVANWVCHNASLSRIDISNNARNVIYLNRLDHLPEQYITW